MRFGSFSFALPRPPRHLLACAAGTACLAQMLAALAGAVPLASALSVASAARQGVSATLEQCLASGAQDERSATFVGEMTAVAGTARMEMRIDVQERMAGERLYHTVSSPGLGVWRGSAPGVKVYRYVRQVTDLAPPAFYRGAIRFRWLNARGRQIAAMELRTPRCEQPAAPAAAGSTAGTASPSAGG
jgi:hypothetical protein